MLEEYFVRPQTVDRIRASWIAPEVERYVGVCRGCGAYTQPRNGKGDAYAYCNCAARRSVVSPAQPGGTRRDVLGSNGLPGSER